jgi:hypothetical protein
MVLAFRVKRSMMSKFSSKLLFFKGRERDSHIFSNGFPQIHLGHRRLMDVDPRSQEGIQPLALHTFSADFSTTFAQSLTF